MVPSLHTRAYTTLPYLATGPLGTEGKREAPPESMRGGGAAGAATKTGT